MIPSLILDWNSFNIAQGSIVKFIQPSTTSTVLNRIHDADPSIIQGDLSANGQVYLINQNGFLFDKGTQINVNTLYASSLNITNSVFQAGVTNTNGNASFGAANSAYDSGPNPGYPTRSITIGANGQGAAPQINSGVGGAIVLIAPVINNVSGIIQSPDGQVILAAGSSAYLSFDTSNIYGNSLRGLLVEVTADPTQPVNLTSLIQNSGTISSPRGNVTLAGLLINQNGRVTASSALLENGSIFLQASAGTVASANSATGVITPDTQRGTVTFGPGSVTATPLDLSDTTTLALSQSYTPYQSLIQVTAQNIINQGNITSPGGSITFNAADPTGVGQGSVYLDSGSVVSAAGAWSTAPYSQNLLSFKVTSNELNNSPDQKGGILEGATVTVDLRTGSSILDLSAYQADEELDLPEKASQGGTITLNSTGDIIARQGSVLNVSGGGIDYSAGVARTTKLLSSGGQIYDIGSAPEGLTYTTILDTFTEQHPRWGYSQSWTNLLYGSSTYEPGYVQGSDGGTLTINPGNGLVLDGKLLGGTTTGPRQTNSPPAAATLDVGVFNPSIKTQNFGIGDVVFAASVVDPLGTAFQPLTQLPVAQKTTLLLPTSIWAVGTVDNSTGTYTTTGFGDVSINANGSITLPQGVDLVGPVGGTLALTANEIHINGSISAVSGTTDLSTVSTVGTATSTLATTGVSLASTGQILNRGSWVNNSQPSTLPSALPSSVTLSTSPLVTRPSADGGTVTISSSSVTLQAGSTIDVSGGGTLSSKGQISGGSGGSITIAAEPGSASHPTLQLDGNLLGYGSAVGGSLTIQARDAQIGGIATSSKEITLAPSLLEQGGFSSYSIATTDDLEMAAGTSVSLEQQNLLVNPVAVSQLPTGSDLSAHVPIGALPESQRGPVSLSLNAGGAFSMGQGAVISTDPGGSVKLSATTALSVDGTISTPSGSISATLSAPVGPNPVLDIGPDAQLLARGAFVPTINNLGLPLGTPKSGGSVSLSATKASIDLEGGSIIDVSGISHELAISNPSATTEPYTSSVVNTNAGIVTVASNTGITLAGTLLGAAKGEAAGGEFTLDFNGRGDLGDLTSGRRVVLSDGLASVASLTNIADVDVNVDALIQGGFDKLHIQSESQILLDGNVNVAFARGVILDTQLLGVSAGGKATVSGADVMLANSYGERVFDPSDQTSSVPLNNGLPSTPQPTTEGTGILDVHGGTVDLFGNVTLTGVASTTLDADHDVRLSGREIGSPTASNTIASLDGSLVTVGQLNIVASQVYPTTGTTFAISVADGLTGTIVPGGQLTISRNGKSRDAVYSAGGSLTLNADQINQNGTVKAPLGSLSLIAGTSLELGPGSLTSVSANGLTIPFGETNAGIDWTYSPWGYAPDFSNALTAPPAKKLNLTAPNINVKSGATIDVAGGGDIQAAEWVSGPGGTSDALIAPNTYAIIPAAQLAQMPIDPDFFDTSTVRNTLGFNTDQNIYNSLKIGKGSIVPAGTYALLPGYYALLPGADLVQVIPGSTYANLASGSTASLQDGLTVVSGHFATLGTNIASYQTVGVVVEPGSYAQKLANYTVSNSSYFAQLAAKNEAPTPPLPRDAGQLVVSASQSLNFSGTLDANVGSRGANGAQVDISAQDIAIVSQVGEAGIPAGFLEISANSLSDLDASVLIGGTRAQGNGGIVITPVATEILVANSQASVLSGPETILVATDSVDLKPGSVIASSGTSGAINQPLSIAPTADNSGAFIRVANGPLVSLSRPLNTDSAQGTAIIESGATIRSTGSLIIDATESTSSQGNLEIAAGGGLALSSSKISLGDVGTLIAPTDGLVLSNSQLAGFNALGTLDLKSYGSVGLYGAVQLGSAQVGNLSIDTAALTGYAGAGGELANATVRAQNTTLVDSSGASVVPVLPSGGTLQVATNDLVLGSGSKTIAGFGEVNLSVTGNLEGSGAGTLQVGSPLNITAGQISVAAGSVQQWTASGNGAVYNVAVNTSGATPLPSLSLGGSLEVDGSQISDNGTIRAHAGTVELNASNGIVLGPAAVIDTSGLAQSFAGGIAIANGGQIELLSSGGSIVGGSGSILNVSSASQGGNAGKLTITGSALDLTGASILGLAPSGTGASASITLNSIGDLGPLALQLAQGGFTGAQDIRVITGELTLASGVTMKANDLALVADSGALTIAGTLDASSPLGGGTVNLAGSTVQIQAGAQILADATSTATGSSSPNANGGTVNVSSSLQPTVANPSPITLSFASGALIDVRGGAQGSSGSVVFQAARTLDDTGVTALLQGTVLAQRSSAQVAGQVDVEGRADYTAGGTITSADITSYANDNATFMAAVNAPSISAGLQGTGSVQVRPAVEVDAPGDLSIQSNWDLTAPGWLNTLPGGSQIEAGTLTVRAAGTLTIGNVSIGNPTTTPPTSATWNINLVGGADLGSANVLQTQSAAALAAQVQSGNAGAGDVVLGVPGASIGAAATVRTGTGNINIAAGHDFVIEGFTGGYAGSTLGGTVYTTGVPVTSVADPYNRYTQGGGNISITAQNDAIGVSNEWLTDWFRTPNGNVSLTNGAWWAYLPAFYDGIGSFGGGAISIVAGHDINDLSAMQVTSATEVGTPSASTLQVFGGGNLTVQAGNDIVGSEYLLGQGTGTITAGASLGTAAQPTQLYIQGLSSDQSLQNTSLKVTAGTDMNISDIIDPTTMERTHSIIPRGQPSSGGTGDVFFSFAPDSSVNLASLGGSVYLGTVPLADAPLSAADEGLVSGYLSLGQALYPPQVAVTAFAGNVTMTGTRGTILYPSTQGELKVWAYGSISDFNAVVSDAGDPATLQDVSNPSIGLIGAQALLTSTVTPERIVTNTNTDQFIDDVVALNGSITSGNLVFPARARVYAGGDIAGTALALQNLNPSDVSEIVANEGTLFSTQQGIQIGGPGSLLVEAGRDIELSTTGGLGGLVATGDLNNSSLPAGSAHIVVVAGVSGPIPLSRLDSLFAQLITDGEADDTAAAQAAVAGFFHGDTIHAGNLDSYLTSIQTYQGSGIDLLAPGGNITVGLSSSEDQTIGVITNTGGAIRSYLSGNFEINAGKVITGQGGNIEIYTSRGGIDAGRGAKTSITTPPPEREAQYDTNGDVVGFIYVLPEAVAGSGIQTVTSKPNGPASVAPPAGSVYLFAPEGTINAGEAGISSGANLFIEAQTVLNASNISSVGTSVGVPTVSVGSVASSLASTSASTSAATTQAANDAAAQAAKAAAAGNSLGPSQLSVDVLGFGDKNCPETDKNCLGGP
jgi:filamentous hemagglutinin family protein